MAKTERLIKLLQMMRAMRPPIKAADLAMEMQVSQRSIYRDIQSLRNMGAIIDGSAGYGYMLIEDPALPPMMFDRTEVEALVLGLREVSLIGDPDLAKAAKQAMAKLRGTIPDRFQSVLDHSVLNARSFRPRIEPNVDVKLLRQAAWDEKVLAIVYKDAEGKTTSRQVYPLSLVYMDNASVLVSWCLLRNGFRVFRLDRIEHMDVLNLSFRPKRAQLLRQFKEEMDRNSASGL